MADGLDPSPSLMDLWIGDREKQFGTNQRAHRANFGVYCEFVRIFRAYPDVVLFHTTNSSPFPHLFMLYSDEELLP